MSDKTESLTDTLAKQAEARFSASSAVEKNERTWIASVVPNYQEKCESASISFQELLKDGVLLCELINKLSETSLTKPSSSNLPFKQRENVSSYLTACEKVGLSQTELFETSDLFESKNLQLVLQHVCALHVFASKHGGSLKEQAAKVSTPAKKAGSSKLSTPESKSILNFTSSGTLTPPVSGSSPASNLKSSNSNVGGGTESPSRPKTPSVASLAADIATKEEFKYNPEVEAAAQRWIERVTGVSSAGQSFYQYLKSGVVLCKLGNTIQANILPHVYEGNLPYRQMENIGWYITACQQLGLRDEELFETADLFTERNLNSVVNHIHVLAHWLTKRPEGWNGPVIEDVRDAKSLFSATLVEGSLSWDPSKSSSSSASAPLTDEQKELLAWANTKMKDFYMFQGGIEDILDLSNDVKSGVKLIHLLVALCRGQSFGIYNTQPTLIWHAMQNASAILAFIASQTFQKVEGVRSVDIVTGNVNAISRLLFYLREKFDLDYLFAQTLGDLSASSSSSASADTASDTIEVELIEGEDVPAHLRPLMSIEDLQYYDQLALERRQRESAAQAAKQQAQRNIDGPKKTISHQTPNKSPNEGKETPKKKDWRKELASTTATTPPAATEPAKPATSTKSLSTATQTDTDTGSGTAIPTVAYPHHEEHDKYDIEVETVESEPVIASDRVKSLSSSQLPELVPIPTPTSANTTSPTQVPTSTSPPTGASSPQTVPTAEPTVSTGKKRTKEGKSSSSSKGLKGSSDSVDSSPGSGKTRKTKDRQHDKQQVNSGTSSPRSDSTPTPEPKNAVEPIGAGNDASDTSNASELPRSDSGVSSQSLQASSESDMGSPSGPNRVTTHSRDRSQTRRVNIKRTATIGAGKVVVTDQEKVLRAQQVVRKHVAVETLTTEQSYLNSLQTLSRDLLEPVKRAKILTPEEFNTLFSNVEAITSYHILFEALLKERISTWDDTSVISDLFLHQTSFFMEYGPYLQNYNKGAVAMHYMRKKYPKFDQLIKSFEDELMKTTMLTVDSFLIMPVQRLPRYRLLLSDIRKYTSPSWQEHMDLEEAIRHVEKILNELNSHIQSDGAEQIRKMLSIESSIQGECPVPIMKIDRRFIKEGPIGIKKLKIGDKTKPDRKKLEERLKGIKAYVFLFNDLLILCETLKHAKSDDKRQFSLIHAYSLHDIFIISEKDRAEKSMDQIANFSIKHVDKKNKDIAFYLHMESDLLVMHASSMEDRDAWMSALQ